MSYPLAPRSYCGGADPAGVGTSELTEMFLRLKQEYPYQPSPDVRNPYTGDPSTQKHGTTNFCVSLPIGWSAAAHLPVTSAQI